MLSRTYDWLWLQNGNDLPATMLTFVCLNYPHFYLRIGIEKRSCFKILNPWTSGLLKPLSPYVLNCPFSSDPFPVEPVDPM